MRFGLLAVVLLLMVLAAALLHRPVRNLIEQDRCLDRGGAWDAVNGCRTDTRGLDPTVTGAYAGTMAVATILRRISGPAPL